MKEKYSTQIMLGSEHLTTRTYSCCGKSNDIKASKVHICSCGMKTERDINAAKNILKVGKDLRKEKAFETRKVTKNELLCNQSRKVS